MTTETAKKTKGAPARKSWVYGILLVFVLAVVAYFGLMNRQDRSTNHDYYRVLYEASNTFNENLIKLDRMHQYKESASSIRSLLPSYSKSNTSSESKHILQSEFDYVLDGQTLEVNNENFSASLIFADILPSPKKGFSQYLFADQEGNVLSTVGGERTISIVDLSSINQEIQRKSKQFQFNLTDQKKSQSSSGKASLPSYSNHVDMKISYGEFRVFVFPFTLSTPLLKTTKDPKVVESLDRVYLVGLLPQHKLAARDSGHWNISLLVVTIISLLFMWTMLRLYLLPKNQSITKSYRVFTNVSSYLFYIVIVALSLAYFQKSLLQNNKDQVVLHYAESLNERINEDLFDVFAGLNGYRHFYQTLLDTLQTVVSDLDEDELPTENHVETINQAVITGLSHISVDGCADIKTNRSRNSEKIGTAATPLGLYPTEDYCENRTNNNEKFSFELDIDAVNILLNSYKSNKSGIDTLDFYSLLHSVKLDPNKSVETYIDSPPDSPLRNKILTVFGLNGDGNSVLPSIYYQESNSLPSTFNLSHRNYYKQVRDHKGWDLALTGNNEPTFKNVYIQRLLNINNGTRGTTISMPLIEPGEEKLNSVGKDHIIGADVLLPSLSLGRLPPLDLTYMIVERSSGDVLFHNDTGRSLVENLYFSGDAGNQISQKINAGLEKQTDTENNLFNGSYHGQKGRFALAPTVVNEWAIVIFYPDDTLHSLMTNQFLFISVSFALAMALMMLSIYTIRSFIWTSALKEKLALPAKLNIRFVMLVSSVMLSASYSFYLLGANIDLLYTGSHYSIWLPLTGVIFATFLLYRGCIKLFSFPPEANLEITKAKSKRGAIWIISAVLIITCMHFFYIQKTAVAQLKSLDFHYQQIGCNWLNYERSELISTGLSRYPNSITSRRIDPLLLLPLQKDWYDTLHNSNSFCDNRFASSNRPEDFPSMGTLIGSIQIWQWINTYLLGTEQPELIGASTAVTEKLKYPIAITFLQALLLITIIILWFKFNAKILWYKLYCPERFMQHITRMTESVRSLESEVRNTRLKIECDTVKLNGVGLALLLRSMSYIATDNNSKVDKPERILLEGFDQLFGMSPCLQKFTHDNSFLPNLKLHLDADPTTGQLNVQIWDIDTCLEKGVFRQLLLDLIMELKSLTLSNQLNSFTIFAGFHSLQRVKMKDPLLLDQSSLLDHAEYLSWAECLMDFIVIVPDNFKRGIDWELLEREVEAFPELQFLSEPYEKTQQQGGWSQILKRDEELYQESNWTTINYVLLNADALYRFKWESCSSAEKLALLNLAKQQRINPTNTQMIEHLALNGLITVRKGHLDIVNRSFAHFVLNAETSATLNQLVSHGEAGLWKNYKLPLGVMILLIIGGIALTSGESIYIIAASMAGVLGTIASVTNSANMLRGGSNE